MQYRSPLIRYGRDIILIGIVAGSYFVLGLLGLLFRFYAEPITILMPSTGFALAATLLCGNRILLGVMIGSFCVNAWAFDFSPAFVSFYAFSAIGAVLSALVGTRLIGKIIGFPNQLLGVKSIGLFMFFGGTVSALISSIVGILAMIAAGIINPAESLMPWLNWWMGDILGVFIFTPITLAFFAEPQLLWNRRRITVVLPVLLAFGLVIVFFFYLKDVDRQQSIQQLKEKTIVFSQAIKNRILLDLDALHGLKNFLSKATTIEPQEILMLTNQTLYSFKEIKLISWINDVENIKEKKQFISVFKQRHPGTPKILRLLSPELRKKIVARPSFANSVFLIPEKNGFKLIIPVIKKNGQNEGALGVVIATLSMEGLINETLHSLNADNFSVTIISGQDSGSDSTVIYTNVESLDQEPFQALTIPIADQTWQLKFYHEWGRDKPIADWYMGWLVLQGLWVTGLLSIALLLLTGRYFRKEKLIEERTKTLMETKAAAELANNAKSQFLAKISHELRTPLNGISGFAQLLEKKPSLNADDKKHVAIIRQCSDSLLRLINDILDISAIESSQLKAENSDLNFALVLKDCVRLCKLKADEKGLELRVENRCLEHYYWGDEKRIRQILVNLIDNAVKYTNRGYVHVAASYEEGVLKVSVTDTGCGIAQHDVEQIFSPFVQLNTSNFVREGVGLGLSITKELVNFMNGKLEVRSELGVGSVFSVSIPLQISGKNQPTAQHQQQHVNARLDGLTVLVVDDNEINLLFLVSMLEQMDCKVESAMNGQEALLLIEQNHYDIALIDINMPIMDGFELTKRIRRQGIRLKLVAVSAYADKDKINEALSIGFDGYITKPIEEEALLELIDTFNS